MTQSWKLTGRDPSSNFVLVLKKDKALLIGHPLASVKTLDSLLNYWVAHAQQQKVLRTIDQALTPGALAAPPTNARLKNRLLNAFKFGWLFASEFKFTLQWREGASQYALLSSLAGPNGFVNQPTPLVGTASTLQHITPGSRGFIVSKDGSHLRTVPYELDRNAPFAVNGVLPPGTPVTVIGRHPQKPEWLHVSTCIQHTLVNGYLQHFRITTELPEPSATLHYVQRGERLEPIAARCYREGIAPGRDLRFYENVILHVNTQYRQKGVRRVDGDVQLVAGEFIWLVSVNFANRLERVVGSGSITGGLFARARQGMSSLNDILASVQQSPRYVQEVLVGEYGKAILENLPVIIGTVALFISLECLSAVLAVSPTGVGQLAAALIQLGLALLGAQGLVEAGVAAAQHAMLWLRTAWTAHGDPKKLAEASKHFLRMLTSIAMAALAFLGMKGNLTKGLSLAKNVRITPPRIEWMVAQGSPGGTVAIPTFKRGSITSVREPPVAPKLQTAAEAGAEGNATKTKANASKESPANNPAKEAPLTSRPLSDAALEQLMEKIPNWEGIKELVGKQVPRPGTAELARLEGQLKQAGYQLVKGSEGRPGYVRRLSGNAKGNEYAQLAMTEEGVVVLKAGGSTRISVFSRYRKNFLELIRKEKGETAYAEAAARISQGKSQLHHLIPDGVAQKNLLIREAYERLDKYTIDRGSNMLDMPSAVEHVDDELYVHLGSHKNYSNHVDALLTRELKQLTQSGKTLLSKVEIESIALAIKRVEDLLRNQIKNGGLPDKVTKELIEDGIPVKVNNKPIRKLSLFRVNPEETELIA